MSIHDWTVTSNTKQAPPFRDTISTRDVDKCPDAIISYCFSWFSFKHLIYFT